MHDIFCLIDGILDDDQPGGGGVNQHDDKKMSLEEWKAARPLLFNCGFVALETRGKTPEEEFEEMNDTDVMVRRTDG